MIEAAELGGFHVLSLINDGTAIALHYAFGKRCGPHLHHPTLRSWRA